jgi:hypothetical protein
MCLRPFFLLKTALASLCGIVFLSSPALSADAHDEGDHDHEFCVGPDPVAEAGFLLPDAPDFFETYPDGSLPRPEASKEAVKSRDGAHFQRSNVLCS